VNLLKLTTIIHDEAAPDVFIIRKPQVAGEIGFSTLMALVHVNSYIAARQPLIMF
jgi:hypothetical protein